MTNLEKLFRRITLISFLVSSFLFSNNNANVSSTLYSQFWFGGTNNSERFNDRANYIGGPGLIFEKKVIEFNNYKLLGGIGFGILEFSRTDSTTSDDLPWVYDMYMKAQYPLNIFDLSFTFYSSNFTTLGIGPGVSFLINPRISLSIDYYLGIFGGITRTEEIINDDILLYTLDEDLLFSGLKINLGYNFLKNNIPKEFEDF